MKFHIMLKLLMERDDISKDSLAQRIKVTTRIVEMWLNNTRTPSLAAAIAVADVFNCSLDELVGRKIRKDG